MTDLNSQPAAIDEPAIVETGQPQEAPQTLEQLTESINKLTANRDTILAEKRIATEQRNHFEGELTAHKAASLDVTDKYQSLMKKVAFDDLLRKVCPMPDSHDFMAYELKDSVELKTVEGVAEAVYIKDGKEYSLEEMAKLVRDNKQYWSHILANVGSGGDSSGGLNSVNRPISGFGKIGTSGSAKTPNGGQFGLK